MRKVRFPKGEREIKKNATDLDRNAAIRLYPYGSAQGTRIATMHSSRIVLHIENTTDVYAYNSSENLMRAVIADGAAWVPHPLEAGSSRMRVDSATISGGAGHVVARTRVSSRSRPSNRSRYQRSRWLIAVRSNRVLRKLCKLVS